MKTSSAAPRLEQSNSPSNVLACTFACVAVMLLVTSLAAYASRGLGASTALILGCGVALAVHAVIVSKLRNSALGLLALATFSATQGLLAGPLLGLVLAQEKFTYLVCAGTGISTLTVLGCAAYAAAGVRGFSRWKGFLASATSILVMGSLLSSLHPVSSLELGIAVVAALGFIAWLLFSMEHVIQSTEKSYVWAAFRVFANTPLEIGEFLVSFRK
jgi:FtsH-binding integral membrane protein